MRALAIAAAFFAGCATGSGEQPTDQTPRTTLGPTQAKVVNADRKITPVAAASAAPAADPCNGIGTCYSSPTFVAEVTRVTTSRPSAGPVNATVVQRVEVRFRNVTDKPIILAHRADTARMVDNRGNRYGYWNPKVNVAGIGLIGNRAVDSSFVIGPNQSRNATFEQRFVYDARQKAPGNTFTFDLEIEEVEPTGSQQLRTVRKNAVAFRDLSG